jgi:hypothetical protein
MFFFNFNRVNMDITNELVTNHMQALFGPARLAALRGAVAGLKGVARERAVMTALEEMTQEAGGQFFLPFRFVVDGRARTSHYLISVTKHFLGYKIMRDVMGKASSYAPDGVPSFEHTSKPPLFLTDGRSIDALAESLMAEYAGTAMQVEEVFEQHSRGKLGIPFHSRPSSSRPPAFGVRPPHCLKKNATPALAH